MSEPFLFGSGFPEPDLGEAFHQLGTANEEMERVRQAVRDSLEEDLTAAGIAIAEAKRKIKDVVTRKIDNVANDLRKIRRDIQVDVAGKLGEAGEFLQQFRGFKPSASRSPSPSRGAPPPFGPLREDPGGGNGQDTLGGGGEDEPLIDPGDGDGIDGGNGDGIGGIRFGERWSYSRGPRSPAEAASIPPCGVFQELPPRLSGIIQGPSGPRLWDGPWFETMKDARVALSQAGKCWSGKGPDEPPEDLTDDDPEEDCHPDPQIPEPDFPSLFANCGGISVPNGWYMLGISGPDAAYAVWQNDETCEVLYTGAGELLDLYTVGGHWHRVGYLYPKCEFVPGCAEGIDGGKIPPCHEWIKRNGGGGVCPPCDKEEEEKLDLEKLCQMVRPCSPGSLQLRDAVGWLAGMRNKDYEGLSRAWMGESYTAVSRFGNAGQIGRFIDNLALQTWKGPESSEDIIVFQDEVRT